MKNGTIKKIFGYYIFWCFLHLIFLAMGWSGDSHQNFWPFEGDSWSGTIKQAYDFSEFLAYVLGPIVLLFSFNYIFEGNLQNAIEDELKKK
ncbi:MAG: hypothetical protein FGM46_04065 [Ferruginibacter sp.]|nr:hypothetical protein [Ferruginibacter sp.]